ncbi:MAG: EAL domain-containing protein [Sulfurimonas sp.]|nr:EAL domain-containing protein [Sulfurimonas sp.]
MFFASLILVSILVGLNYSNIKSRHHKELKHYSRVVSRTIHNNLLQEDMLLTMIGKQLLTSDRYKNKQNIQDYFDKFLKQKTNYLAIGLVDINGSFISVSSNINAPKGYSFLKNKKTEHSFRETLKSHKMIAGRTYMFKNVDEWIIPLRKSIFDEDGNFIAVMAVALNNSKSSEIIHDLGISNDKVILVVKDYDHEKKMYRQYVSKIKEIPMNKLYDIPMEETTIKALRKELKINHGLSLDELRESEETLCVDMKTILNINLTAGLTYNKDYNMWIIVKENHIDIMSDFFHNLYIYIALFIVGFTIVYILFRKLDMSDKQKQNELIYQAQHDILTKLPNRNYMYANIENWKKSHSNNYYVLYLDLDNFKNINDKFGHSVGDKILVKVAHRLSAYFKRNEMLIRQGGDEFIVLRESVGDGKIEKSIQDLISFISKVYHIDAKEFRIGVSVGVARYPIDAKESEELLSIADTAMYEAKKRKNSYCFFSETMRYENIIKTDIEQELRSAIEKDELWMVYQPQIKEDGSLYGVEALVRWENKKLGFIGPDKFISVAEETGIIRELGVFIIETALREITSVKEELKINFSLSINISAVQLMEADFLTTFLAHIEKANFDKESLTLEITESVSIGKLDDILKILYALQEHNIKISLDDFGTGYSSLSILRELPVDELKIDKSFIDKILHDKSEKALVQSIINIGKNFNMTTLAEGVESGRQVKELRELNCDIFQGYYYSKPLTKEHLLEYLKQQ